jgi:hypothetical protein
MDELVPYYPWLASGAEPSEIRRQRAVSPPADAGYRAAQRRRPTRSPGQRWLRAALWEA